MGQTAPSISGKFGPETEMSARGCPMLAPGANITVARLRVRIVLSPTADLRPGPRRLDTLSCKGGVYARTAHWAFQQPGGTHTSTRADIHTHTLKHT